MRRAHADHGWEIWFGLDWGRHCTEWDVKHNKEEDEQKLEGQRRKGGIQKGCNERWGEFRSTLILQSRLRQENPFFSLFSSWVIQFIHPDLLYTESTSGFNSKNHLYCGQIPRFISVYLYLQGFLSSSAQMFKKVFHTTCAFIRVKISSSLFFLLSFYLLLPSVIHF